MDVQCISANGVPAPRTACTVRSISSGVDMPVEMIIGFALRAMCRCIGRCVSSPEPVLNAGTPIVSRKSAASRENGVDRNRMPFFSARSRSSTCASRDSAVRVSRSNSDSPT